MQNCKITLAILIRKCLKCELHIKFAITRGKNSELQHKSHNNLIFIFCGEKKKQLGEFREKASKFWKKDRIVR